MLLIVLHHYCVNSGFGEVIDLNEITVNTILVQFMAIGGKVGVNIFFLISGYFMIRSAMKWHKVWRLLIEIVFYNIVVFIFLTLLGYKYGIWNYARIVPIIFSIPTSFIGNYLVVYLLSPVINKFLSNIDRKEFNWLLSILLCYFCILQTFFLQNTWHYLGWAFTMYCVGAYIRRYDIDKLNIPYGKISIALVFITWLCILAVDFVGVKYGFNRWDYVIFDANKLNMFLLGASIFLAFLKCKVSYNKFINIIGGASFGVLLIHANNDVMRQWLWKDFLKNTYYYDNPNLWIHMFVSVILIYVVCTFIEIARQKYVEKPLFRLLEKS